MDAGPQPAIAAKLAAPVAGPWQRLGDWPRRRWVAAGLGAVSIAVLIGVSTAMIPSPIFGREVATTWWAWPVLAITAALGGLLGATYVRDPEAPRREGRFGLAGGVLSYFAVGCPVCNKLALLALGYTGALQWFAPVQPFLGVAGLVLLAYALWRRLVGETACAIPEQA
ncbi:hypothetical protein [Propionicimonas sp.]|uniref:hypothetical protein n=1 Tax=Propionicimonas sp. TaxID=1955623 RepID=UPI0025E1257C|nr:hypothetical protein [Propionicimonas sp.]MCG2806579.1 hypothetical protein [Propionicimonas sp.]